MKDIPKSVWQSYNKGNKQKMVICNKEQFPADKTFRNTWRLAA
jgi:hypothetical protein